MWIFAPSDASAADLTVGPLAAYATVDDALDDAVTGDRVLVEPGAWDVPEAAVSIALEIAASGGAGTVTLRATSGQSMFDVRAGGALTLRDLRVDGDGRRLAIVNAGSLTLFTCEVVGTESQGVGQDGGAIRASAATITADACTFDGGRAGQDGGAVYADAGSVVTVTGSTFRAGQARDGGALALTASDLTVSGTTFEANNAQRGSAIHLTATPASIDGATFVGNVATGSGTVSCADAACSVRGSTFDGNTAPAGAAVAGTRADLAVVSSTLCRSGGGGAVIVSQGSLRLENDVFVSNTSMGALVSADTSDVEVSAVHFVANTSVGGVVASDTSAVDLRNTLLAWNEAAGSVVDVPVADLTGGWSLFHQNLATDLTGPLRPTDVAADPGFARPPAGSCDPALLVPPPGSPAIDAGDPGLVDADGSRSDIGAFGGAEPPIDVTDEDGDGWTVGLDCDDLDAAVNPDAAEVPCDDVDQDCDPATPDDADSDGDGVSVCDGDCDDTNAARTELLDVYRDRDEDGFGVGDPTTLCGMPAAEASLVGGDCDDTDADRFPENPEVPYDGVDQDCDDADLVDVDVDGTPFPDDCDDEAPGVFPGAHDLPADGVDQDCTGFDASEVLVGGSGVSCGCATGSGGAAPGLLAALFVLRRRRVSGRSGTR